MSGCLIVGAAPAPDPSGFYGRLLGEASCVIAADAAGEWCAGLGRVPDVTVGDFDSARAGAAERLAAAGCEIVHLPSVKDVSDLDAAAGVARSRVTGRLTFTAAFDGRIDHTLAAVGCVMRCGEGGAGIQEPGWWAETVNAGAVPREFDMSTGTLFTVVSAAGAGGVSITGAVYPLTEAELTALSSLGLSNIADGPGVTIGVKAGMVLVIAQR